MTFLEITLKRIMAEYVSVGEFSQGWNFFAKNICFDEEDEGDEGDTACSGEFPCSDFSCSGCDDWLNCENQNRNVKILKHNLFLFSIYPVETSYCKFLTINKEFQAEARITVGRGRPGQSFQGQVSWQRCCYEIRAARSS